MPVYHTPTQRTQTHRGARDLQYYVDKCHQGDDEGSYMLSWRSTGAPVFTLAYRGSEVDALVGGCDVVGDGCADKRRKKKRPHYSTLSPECTPASRTILFSHSTGECFIAKGSVHLQVCVWSSLGLEFWGWFVGLLTPVCRVCVCVCVYRKGIHT